MDSKRFDLFTRRLASGMTRREAVRRLVVGGTAATGGLAFGAVQAKKHHHRHHGGNGGDGGNGERVWR